LGPTTLLTDMTGIFLHMQWPLTSQLHIRLHFVESLDKISAQSLACMYIGMCELVNTVDHIQGDQMSL
jgi:hypothetical protein